MEREGSERRQSGFGDDEVIVTWAERLLPSSIIGRESGSL